MNIIRLTKGQRRQSKISHPLLDGATPMTEDQIQDSWEAGDSDKIILGMLFLVKVIVSRFLANWPETRIFEEDMVSEGAVAVIESVGSGVTSPKFYGNTWIRIRVAIEDMLNRDRSLFAPSRRTQWNILKKGLDPIYNYAKQLHEGTESGLSDYSLEFIDIADELDKLSEEKKSQMRVIIKNCIEQDHKKMECGLTQVEKEAIENITQTIIGM